VTALRHPRRINRSTATHHGVIDQKAHHVDGRNRAARTEAFCLKSGPHIGIFSARNQRCIAVAGFHPSILHFVLARRTSDGITKRIDDARAKGLVSWAR
jgi:hypothetical protein